MAYYGYYPSYDAQYDTLAYEYSGHQYNTRKRGRYQESTNRKYYQDQAHEYSHKKSRRHSSESHKSSSRERSTIIPEWDDDERHYIIHLGESLTPRYKILDILGEGTFGKVVECWDREKKVYVAVKIIRAIEKYRDAAMIEIDVLNTIRKNDPHCEQPCVQMVSWFEFRGHVCMVFQKYGLSIYDFLRRNSYRAFQLQDVKAMSYQLIYSVAFLHSLTLIHTDLKPENILFVNSEYTTSESPASSPVSRSSRGSEASSYRTPKNTALKLIDLGSATFDSHYHTTVVSTRHYRAPEVLLGLGWTYPCDMWSIGCILIELYTGDALFQTHENREHLAMMEKVFGPVPETMIDSADRYSQKYFRRDGSIEFPNPSEPHEHQRQLERLSRVKPLSELVKPEDALFLSLLKELLRFEPEKRLTAAEALEHPFFAGEREKYNFAPITSTKALQTAHKSASNGR